MGCLGFLWILVPPAFWNQELQLLKDSQGLICSRATWGFVGEVKADLTSTSFPFQLCFALSVLGDPTVMLWDEPSVGMDVTGQRRMW